MPADTYTTVGAERTIKTSEEYMKRECTNCYYICKEAPLDAIESKGQQDERS